MGKAVQRRRADAGVEIGRGIRKLRKQRNWKQGVLAEKTGLAIPTISLIETGNTNPSIYDLEQIAKALGTTVAGLMVVSRKSLRNKDQDLIDYVGNAVKRRRLELGLSRQELADKAGFLPQYISTTENCRRLPRIPNIYKLAEALEVSVLYFWPNSKCSVEINPLPPPEIGQRICGLRSARNMSKNVFSLSVGISTHQLAAIEEGASIPKFSTLLLIASALNISPYDLLNNDLRKS